jgi:excinuclease ABC subunit C
VRHLAERQAADKRAIGTVDVIGIAVGGDGAAVQVFPLRGGRLTDRHSFFLENVAGQDLDSLLEAFALEYYGSAPSIPPQIIVPPEARPSGALSEFLSEERGSRVEVRPAQRGEKRRLQELAQQNAELALESLPLRIECFDISNIQDQAPVGSMVVFQDALPKKAHYRKFGIRKEGGQDDFAMMAEVVSRRFARARPATTNETYDEGFAAIPNLVVIDGGKGQLSAALAAMQAYDLPRVAVIALAKREEEVFVPGRPDPIALDPASPGLQLLQRIRDEAHRFALGFHRQRRESRAHESILDALPGVGPARRRALMTHFGSPERILAAGPEEFEGVPGVPSKTGRRIYEALHKAGGA